MGLTGARAAVYLVLAHSWQEKDYYENRTMQAFAEKVLSLSAQLDDDGTLVFATGREPFVEEISLDNDKSLLAALHTQMDWSWDGTSIAMRAVIDHYENSGATDPALVIYQVGGEPDEKSDVRTLLRNTAGMNIYWHFEGFGASKDFAFYRNLNATSGHKFDNVDFHFAGKDPLATTDSELYAHITGRFATWLKDRS